MFLSSYISSCVCSSVSGVSSSLESGSGMDILFNILIWGFPCNLLSRVSLYFMSALSLSVLLLAVDSVEV